MSMRMVVRWETEKTFEVDEDTLLDAETAAAVAMREHLAEMFEDGTPSMEEFDIFESGE